METRARNPVRENSHALVGNRIMVNPAGDRMHQRIADIKVRGTMIIIYAGRCQVATSDEVESKGKMDRSGRMAKMAPGPKVSITSRITGIAAMAMAEKKKNEAGVSSNLLQR